MHDRALSVVHNLQKPRAQSSNVIRIIFPNAPHNSTTYRRDSINHWIFRVAEVAMPLLEWDQETKWHRPPDLVPVSSVTTCLALWHLKWCIVAVQLCHACDGQARYPAEKVK